MWNHLVYNLYHQFVQGTEKFSTPSHTSKYFIYYSNDCSDKTISQEESKEILFFKVEILKMQFSQQTALSTHAILAKSLFPKRKLLFFLIKNFLIY